MSDFYIIGENHGIAVSTDASTISSVEHAGTTYVYWHDATSQIQLSTSTNGTTWSSPVSVLTAAADTDIRPAGVVWNGTQFVMALATINTISGAVSTTLLGSSDGIDWSTLSTVSWSEYWAHPTHLVWTGTYYYLAATVRDVFNGPLQSMVKRASSEAGPWTSLGLVDQLTSKDNVWPQVAVDGSDVHLVHREGDFNAANVADRILHTMYRTDSWGSTQIAAEGGTGNPGIALLTGGWAVIYQDQSVQAGRGIWSWLFYDGSNYARRGTFSQNFEYGMGGSVLATTSGFTVFYATVTSATASTLYARSFVNVSDEPESTYVSRGTAEHTPADQDQLPNFQFEVSYGSIWLSLTDGDRFYLGPEDFGSHAQVRRRINATSPYYEGTYLIHSVRENVQESLLVNVLGVSANEVTENLLLLEELISQPSFQMRLTLEDHVETWSCQTADYTIERGHIQLHNTRAIMRISVPRLPEVTYEVT
jgi:hypothetical protein